MVFYTGVSLGKVVVMWERTMQRITAASKRLMQRGEDIEANTARSAVPYARTRLSGVFWRVWLARHRLTRAGPAPKIKRRTSDATDGPEGG